MIELSIREAVSRWTLEGRRIAGASVVTKEGSSPHMGGLVLVVNDVGQLAGAFSGGCVDGEMVLACEQVLKTNKPQFLQFGSDGDLFGATGLVCGGKIEVWLYELSKEMGDALSLISNEHRVLCINCSEDRNQMQQYVVDKPTAISAIKCNHDNSEDPINRAAHFLLNDQQHMRLTLLPTGEKEFLERIGHRELALIVGKSSFTDTLCQLARMLDYHVVVCEPRNRFAKAITCADEVSESWPNECIDNLMAKGRLGFGSVIIVCTHDRKFDEPALCAAVRSPAGFIGALGSRQTIEDRRARLLAAGLSEFEIARIRSPLGLDLGSGTSAETAVSIFAEIIAIRNERSGKPLTELSGKIHGK